MYLKEAVVLRMTPLSKVQAEWNGSNEFHNTDKTVPIHPRLPDNTVIADTSLVPRSAALCKRRRQTEIGIRRKSSDPEWPDLWG